MFKYKAITGVNGPVSKCFNLSVGHSRSLPNACLSVADNCYTKGAVLPTYVYSTNLTVLTEKILLIHRVLISTDIFKYDKYFNNENSPS